MHLFIKHFLITLLIIVHGYTAKAQGKNTKAYFGPGIGLDYGGIGLKAEISPIQGLGIFGGFGYNLVEPAYCGGLTFEILPHANKVTPVLLAMYGYNAALKVNNGSYNEFKKSYYGPTLGAGINIKESENSNKVSLFVLLPFRNETFKHDYNTYNVKNPLPVNISIGFNFSISKNR